jgi:O-antigen/teichoic acid export membrane protein
MAEALEEEPAVPGREARSSVQSIFRSPNLFVVMWVVQLGAVALFLPLNTRLLGPARFGRVAAAIALTQVLYSLGNLQIQSSVQRRQDEGRDDDARRLILLAMAMALGATALAYVTGPAWSDALGFGHFTGTPRWAVLWAGAIALTAGSLSLLKSQARAGPFCTVTLLQSLGGQILAVVFVVVGHRTASMFVLGLLAGQVAAAIVALGCARPKWVNPGDLQLARAALADSLPLAPGAIAAAVLVSFDRLIVQSRLGPVAAGRYQLADAFGALIILLFGGLSLGWVHRVAAIKDRPTRALVLASTRDSAYRTLLPVVVAICVGAPVLLRVVAPVSFRPDGLTFVLSILTLSALPYAGSWAYATVLLVSGQTWTLAWAIVVAAAVNVDLTLVLVPTWHIAGAAAATLVSYSVLWGLTRWRANREWRIGHLPPKTLLTLAGGIAYVLLWSRAPTSAPWLVVRMAHVAAGIVWLVVVAKSRVARRAPAGWVPSALLRRLGPGPSVGDANGTSDPAHVAPAGSLGTVAGRLKRSLPAGLLDSGFSSLSSFLMGLVATHYLMPKELGEYSVFYAAFALAAVVPATLIFTPIEVTALDLPRHERLSILRWSVPLGALAGLVSGIVVCAAVIPLAAKVGLAVRIEFAATVVVLSCVSPVQDHLRRMFHQGGRSWTAARTSIVQVATVALFIVVARLSGLPLPLVPFGALALGNLVSCGAGFITARTTRGRRPARSSTGEVIRGGGWLTGGTVFSFAAGLAAVTILTDRSGAVRAGQAEAARVLSQPVTVIAVGVLAVFGPELMAAAQHGLGIRVNKMMVGFIGVVAAATVVWLVAVGIPWPWSPIRHTFSIAYEIRGLTAWTIVQQSLAYGSLAYRAVLIGNGQGSSVGKLDIFANVLAVIAVYFGAPYFGAFALVWAFLGVDLLLFGVRGRMAARSVRAAADPSGTG